MSSTPMQHAPRAVVRRSTFLGVALANIIPWAVLAAFTESRRSGALVFAVLVVALPAWVVRALSQTFVQIVVHGLRRRYLGVAAFVLAEALAALWTVGVAESPSGGRWVLAVVTRVPDAGAYWLLVARRRPEHERWRGVVRATPRLLVGAAFLGGALVMITIGST